MKETHLEGCCGGSSSCGQDPPELFHVFLSVAESCLRSPSRQTVLLSAQGISSSLTLFLWKDGEGSVGFIAWNELSELNK